MQVRAAQVEDAAAIARVQVDTWRAAYAGIVPEEYLAQISYEERAERMRTRLSESAGQCCFVAEDDAGQVVGFAFGGLGRDGDPQYRGELYAIYVLPDAQRDGLGRRLTQAVAQWLLAHGLHNMLIWTLAENRAGCAFYEALGGQPVRRRSITIGGKELAETGYGYDDIRLLAGL